MRHQPKTLKSHSYLLASKDPTQYTKDLLHYSKDHLQYSKQNKQNQNLLNIKHIKHNHNQLKPKPQTKIQTKGEAKLQFKLQSQIQSKHQSKSQQTSLPNHPALLKSYELPLLNKKPSQQSTSTTTSLFSKLQLQPLTLKQQYSLHTASTYSHDILTHYCTHSKPCDDFLKDHAITSNLRAKMVDWVIEVLSSYKMNEDTFFRSLKIMDTYLKKTLVRQQIKDLHLIGVASMFTASKYEEIYPIKLDTMYDKIARKKFQKDQILNKESELLASLNFRMEEVNVYDILKNLTFEIKLNITEDQKIYLEQIVLYLAKMSLFSYELAQEDTKLLASAVYFIALKTLEQVEPLLKPEEHLEEIGKVLSTNEEKMIEVSRKVLELAKNFSTVFPNLGNLKKFNKFEYKKKPGTTRVV